MCVVGLAVLEHSLLDPLGLGLVGWLDLKIPPDVWPFLFSPNPMIGAGQGLASTAWFRDPKLLLEIFQSPVICRLSVLVRARVRALVRARVCLGVLLRQPLCIQDVES